MLIDRGKSQVVPVISLNNTNRKRAVTQRSTYLMLTSLELTHRIDEVRFMIILLMMEFIIQI
jgi:hypothetical protein